MRARSLYRAPASFRVTADWVTVESGGPSGYLAAPQGCMLFGAIVAAPDEGGVGEPCQERARRLAAEGFVTLAIDPFGKESAGSEAAVPVLQAGFDYLADRLDVDAECIGALGYGRGGGAVLAWRRLSNKLACAVTFCARPESRNSGASDLDAVCPAQLHFWEEDPESPFEDALALKQDLERDGESFGEFHAYPGAPCWDLDFADGANSLALQRMTSFFRRHLGDWITG